MTTAVQASLSINLTTNDEGEVEPRSLIGIQPNDKMALLIAKMSNPHYVITVASGETSAHGDSTDYLRFRRTDFEIVSIKRAYRYLQFVKPGLNRISVGVIDIRTTDTRKTLDREMKNLGRVESDTGRINSYKSERYVIPDGGNESRTFFDYECVIPMLEIQGHLDVEVDKDLFASPPSGWRKAVVEHWFGSKGLDQCGYRKRWMSGTAAEFFAQIAGLIVRPVCVILVLLFACREIRWKSYFSLRIKAVWDDSGSSRWYTDEDGYYRRGWVRMYNPATASAVAAGAFIVPAIVFAIFNIRAHRGTSAQSYPIVDWGWWQTVLVIDASIVVGALLIVTFFWLRSLSKQALLKWRRRSNAQARKPLGVDHDAVLQAIRASAMQSERLEWRAVPNKTVVLRFNHLKSQVCKPFAQ